MKKSIAILLAFLSLLISVSGLAQSQLSWNRTCTKKTTDYATLYSWSEETGKLVSKGSVPAGSYIKITSTSDQVCRDHGVSKITYCTSDGNTVSGYIYPSVITSATASVQLNNGKYVNVPEALLSDTTELYKYLWKNYEDGMSDTKANNKKLVDNAAASANRAAAFSIEYPTASGDTQVVSLTTLGLVHSQISRGGNKQTILTRDLYWTTEAPEGSTIAVVYAPKTGKASMYAKANKSSTIIKKCVAGKLLLVINKGSVYSRVWYDGQIGYMQNSTLNFFGPMDSEETTTAVLSYKGRTNGRAKVNLRQAPKKNSRIICKYPTGTKVDVISIDGAWYEVDIGGWHGYVQSAYIQR